MTRDVRDWPVLPDSEWCDLRDMLGLDDAHTAADRVAVLHAERAARIAAIRFPLDNPTASLLVARRSNLLALEAVEQTLRSIGEPLHANA